MKNGIHQNHDNTGDDGSNNSKMRISRAPIYRTRWEHRALYNTHIHTPTHTHARARAHARTHAHTHTRASDEGIIGRAVEKKVLK